MPRALAVAAAAAAAATAAAAAAYLYRHRATATAASAAPPRPRIAVASKAKQKTEAAARALGGDAVGYECASLVSEQPMGIEETLRGAKNRLVALVDQLGEAPEVDVVVAIENGIIKAAPQGAEEAWIDLAVVVLRELESGKESVSTSAGVQFPTEHVGTWVEDGAEGTVSQVIAEALGCDKQDPHAALTKAAFTRSALLEHAIRVAAATTHTKHVLPAGAADDDMGF